MTATAFEGDRKKCPAGGMDDYLSKPSRARAFPTLLAKHAPAAGFDNGAALGKADLDEVRLNGQACLAAIASRQARLRSAWEDGARNGAPTGVADRPAGALFGAPGGAAAASIERDLTRGAAVNRAGRFPALQYQAALGSAALARALQQP